MAAGDPVLADYALYWQGLADFQSGAYDIAMDELRTYRLKYPDSVMSDSAVATLAQAALALNRPEEAGGGARFYPQHRRKRFATAAACWKAQEK